jgi:hypothetical protein
MQKTAETRPAKAEDVVIPLKHTNQEHAELMGVGGGISTAADRCELVEARISAQGSPFRAGRQLCSMSAKKCDW